MQILKNEIKKILIFKLCCFGDMVFIVPSIRALQQNFPAAEIVMITNSWVKDLIPYIPFIKKSISFDLSFNDGLFAKILNAIKLFIILRKEKFDMVFSGHRNKLFALILKLAKIKYRIGFNGTKYYNITGRFDETINEPERYLNVLKNNNIAVDKIDIRLNRILEKDKIREKYKFNKNDFILGIFPFGGINPGTDMDIKRWDLENYFKLIININKLYPDVKILLFEGFTENEKTVEIKGDISAEKLQINLELIQTCDVFVGGDTGPTHIAEAFNISTLSIYGPSNPELVSAEYYYKSETAVFKSVWKKPVCSPCYTPLTVSDRKNKKYWQKDSFICYMKDNHCIKMIEVDEVLVELSEIINKIKQN